MFNTFSIDHRRLSVRPHVDDSAEDLWDLVLHGIGTGPGPDRPAHRVRRSARLRRPAPSWR